MESKRMNVFKIINKKKIDNFYKQDFINEHFNKLSKEDAELAWNQLKDELLSSKKTYKIINIDKDISYILYRGSTEDSIMNELYGYYSDVYTGQKLVELISDWTSKNRRFFVGDLIEKSKEKSDKIITVYGLRRTGKTIGIYQTINELLKETDKIAFINMTNKNTMNDLKHDINILLNNEYQYIFIDEITLLEDFSLECTVLSNEFAKRTKLIMSGTDSYLLSLNEDNSLLARLEKINTTYMSFKEFKHLFPDRNIIDYVKTGGILDKDPNYILTHSEEYVKNSIIENIIKSINRSLKEDKDKLNLPTDNTKESNKKLYHIINKTIQESNKAFILSLITTLYKNNDLGSAFEQILKNSNKGLTDLEKDDIKLFKKKESDKIQEKIRIRLGINTAPYQNINQDELTDALRILRKIEVLDDYTVLRDKNESDSTVQIYTQPGLRYSQTEILVKELKNNSKFNNLSIKEKDEIETKILQETEGRLIEHMTIVNILKNYNNKKYNVCQYSSQYGEIDLVIYNIEDNILDLYEIKRSDKQVNEQAKWLTYNRLNKKVQEKIGISITNRYVLYRGLSYEDDILDIKEPTSNFKPHIVYKNIEEFLLQ